MDSLSVYITMCTHESQLTCIIVLGLHSQHVYTLHLLLFPALHPIKPSAKLSQLHNVPDRETNYLTVLRHPKVLQVNTEQVCPALPNPVILNQDIFIA